MRLISIARPASSAIPFWFNLTVKAALIILLVFGAFSGLQQFEGKAFLWRLATYPVADLVVPAAWVAARQTSSYPFAVDVLVTMPFLIDTTGNALDLYDTVWWWDDANHFVNWALLSGAAAAIAWRNRTGSWQAFAYVVGFGAVTAILWEFAEYFAFIRNSPELTTAYTDTLGDLLLGLAGSTLSGLAVTLALRSADNQRMPAEEQ